MVHNPLKVFKNAFSSERLRLPNKPLNETSLPYPLASDVSVEDYNSFIESGEISGYKFEYKNGTVYIVDMCSNEHEAIIEVLRDSFRAHCPITTYAIYNAPIQIRGQPLHESPAGDRTLIAPDLAVFPHPTYVPDPPVPHPGPPPSDTRGNSYARIICEIAMAQTSSNLNVKCRLWKLQSYVRSVLGIKLYNIMNTRNNPQRKRDRAMKVYFIGVPKQKWKFGTVNKDGSPTGPTGCHGPNDPNYIITIPVSDVFYDPAIPAIGYTPLPPPATLMTAVFEINLYEIQQMVLLSQAK
ncbi:13319_t:CDS:2 [Cetraspora pellucida]|uniref:13319_t:CDS:1 n=1 Tax=Cetraspora pellucida TaxID=1433469 RepID=A0ACA9KGR6_9GLOM|nr:13319_t:CDS:2 [Cetraspora pellucida]